MATQKSQEREEYINYLEPILSKFEPVYGDKPWSRARNHAIIVIVLGALATVAAAFFPLVGLELIWVFLGVALGIALFIPTWFAARQLSLQKQEENPDFISLKKRYSPAQRVRTGIIAFVLMIVVMTVVLGTLPQIAGGIIAVAGLLGIYSYIQRTPEEFDAYLEGEVDPRDQPAEDEEDTDDEELTPARIAEAEEFAKLVNSLPEDQRKIILNPNLNGMIAVHEEDDKKKSKKGLFRRG